MESFVVPRVVTVQATSDFKLEVGFDNGVHKVYDCRRLLRYPPFEKLVNNALFYSVAVDPGGYGVSWDDELDASEWELWEGSEPLMP